MKSLSAILALLISLLLLATTIESRRGIGEYWKNVMKEQPIPEAIGGLLVDISDSTPKEKSDCHEKVKKTFVEVEVEEFKPRPDVTAYHDDESKTKYSAKDSKSQPKSQAYPDNNDTKAKQPFEDDFEPRPNISAYND